MMRQSDIDHCIAALRILPTKSPFRKISDPAHNRMLTRTAREQLAQALEDANRPADRSVPDADDESAQRAQVLT